MVIQIAETMLKLSWIRTVVQLLSIAAFAIVTITAKPAIMSNALRPLTEASCCVTMMQDLVKCPIGSGMSGSSCCNMQTCLQLFLQTEEQCLEPGSADFRWENFDSRAFARRERPPVPPPRA